ncbi:hypothetical protein CSA37_04805 [Candidatus Fermentibacteria bacterium]|nr:MAG: hypothetical protein CSA37_04805 [Candidatus Fermentibacteria bacterium]
MLCVRLAGKLRKEGRSSEALDVARKGLDKWGNNVSVNVVFGRCALDNNFSDEAKAAFEKVISLDPLNLIAIKSLGKLNFQEGNLDKAVELFEEYLFEYPGDPDIEEMLASTRQKLNALKQEARLTGQNVTYPDTERMASILAAQDSGKKESDELKSLTIEHSVSVEAEPFAEPPSESKEPSRAPRSLYDLFTSEEREELGLTAFDK